MPNGLTHSATVKRLAEVYRDTPAAPLPQRLLNDYEAAVEEYFARIPVPVEWTYAGQPFDTADDMANATQRDGVLRMYAAPSILGPLYAKHRAVHDWFGHIVPDIPFGIAGEIESYRLHRKQFAPEFHPIIFCDVVLVNAYYAHFRQWFPAEKWVLINDKDVLT